MTSQLFDTILPLYAKLINNTLFKFLYWKPTGWKLVQAWTMFTKTEGKTTWSQTSYSQVFDSSLQNLIMLHKLRHIETVSFQTMVCLILHLFEP